jgi:urease accessory protein
MAAYQSRLQVTVMNISNRLIAGLAGTLFLFSGVASAHTFGAQGAGMSEGLVHPFVGIDHLLAMLAAGIWAAQLGGRALWQVPLAFVTVMAGGAWLAQLGVAVSLVELMIAGSVVVLGVLIAGSIRVSSPVSVMAVSLFALFHGYAHGLEMPQAGNPWAYAAGFVLATLCLHLLGIALGLSLNRMRMLSRIGGAGIAVTGVYLLASL